MALNDHIGPITEGDIKKAKTLPTLSWAILWATVPARFAGGNVKTWPISVL